MAHSPLSRAAETARILSEKIVCEMWADVDLREACLGVKEGLPEDDPCDDFISHWLAGDHIPRAESFHEVKAGVGAALEKCLSVTGEGILLIVSHWGVFAALSSRLGVAFQEPEHCLPYGFTRSGSGWQVRRSG